MDEQIATFVAGIEARSADAVRAALAPNFAGRANGRSLDSTGQVALLESFWTGFPDATFTIEATGGAGHHVIAWTISGTHGGTYLGVPATGTPVKFSGFIMATSNLSGITGLDWKWDTKAFVQLVLGPEIPEVVIGPPKHRPDPSYKWTGRQQPRGGRAKPRGPEQPRSEQGPAQPGSEQPGPTPGGRRRRGRGPKPLEARPEGAASEGARSEAVASEGADSSVPAQPQAAAPEPAVAEAAAPASQSVQSEPSSET